MTTHDDTTSRPHALYRFYNAEGALLYVGITADPGARWRQHAGDKPWWQQVANITIDTHATRHDVLAAERAAIIAEHPRHNIVHNHGRRATTEQPTTTHQRATYDSSLNDWTFTSLRSGLERTSDLYLDWEVEGTAMSDDWTPDDITAEELLHRWARRYATPRVPIYWTLRPVGETAPFQTGFEWADGRNFLTYYSWPRHAHTDTPLNFNRLPVIDNGWNHERADKGGFFQQATGWKPAPLQGHVDIKHVFAAARLPLPNLPRDGGDA